MASKTTATKPLRVDRSGTNGSVNGRRPWNANDFSQKTRALRGLLDTYIIGQQEGTRFLVAGIVLRDAIGLRGPSGIGKSESPEILGRAILDDVESQAVTVTCYQGMSRVRLYGSENPMTGEETRPTFHRKAIQITLDEIGQAAEEDMTHLHQVIGRREVVREGMDNFELHPNAYFILTSNTPDYAANTDPTEAMMDRIGVMVPYGYLTEADLNKFDEIEDLKDVTLHKSRWTSDDLAAAQLYIDMSTVDTKIKLVASFLGGNIGRCELWDTNGRASVRAKASIQNYTNVLMLMDNAPMTAQAIAGTLKDVIWKTLYHRLRPANKGVSTEEKRKLIFWEWLFGAVREGSAHNNEDVREVFKALGKILSNDPQARRANAAIAATQ